MAVGNLEVKNSRYERVHSWEKAYFYDLFIRNCHFNWGVMGVTTYSRSDLVTEKNSLDVEKIYTIFHAITRSGPKFKRIIKKLPLVGGSWWVPDENFSISNHVSFHTEVDPDKEALKRLVNDLSEESFPVDKPYWQVVIVDNPDANTLTTITKIHHGLIQQYPMALAEIFNDQAVETGRDAEDNVETVSVKKLLMEEVFFKAKTVFGFIPLIKKIFLSFSDGDYSLKQKLIAFFSLFRLVSSLVFNWRNNIDNGMIKKKRTIDWFSSSRRDILLFAKAHEATFNDVYVSMLGGAFRKTLLARGYSERQLEKLNICAALPVTSSKADWGVAAMLCRIPVHLPSMKARVESIRDQLKQTKKDKMHLAIQLMGPLSFILGFIQGPFKVSSLIASNIPGLDMDLYLAGSKSKVLSMHPVGAVTPGQPLVVGIISDGDETQWGLNFDSHLYPDAEIFVEGIKEEASVIARFCEDLQAYPIEEKLKKNGSELILQEWKNAS